MKQFAYLLREALTSLRANRTSTLVGVLTTGFTITSFGIFLLLYLNVQKVVGTLQDHVELVVYLKEDFSSEEKSQLERWLKQEPSVEEVSFISKKQALEDFHHQFPDESFLLDGIGGNPFTRVLCRDHLSKLQFGHFCVECSHSSAGASRS